MRYFGSKEQLFAVAADFTIRSQMPTEIPREEVGRTFAENYLRLWEGEMEGLPMLLRSAASSEQAAERMREIFAKQIVPIVTAVSGKAGAPERAGLVASQLLGIALCRYILKLPPVVNMPKRKLVDAVGETLQRYMTE
jgi:AcrR family transcriptional regulator